MSDQQPFLCGTFGEDHGTSNEPLTQILGWYAVMKQVIKLLPVVTWDCMPIMGEAMALVKKQTSSRGLGLEKEWLHSL